MPVHDTTGTTAVLVVNYVSSALLAANLVRSVDDQLVVVTDNWTTETERATVLDLAAGHGWLVETPASNTGFGGGMNLAAARALEAGATSLLLLNPDARVTPADIRGLVARVEADPSLLVAPRINDSDGRPWMGGLMDLRLADGVSRASVRRPHGADVVEWVSGAVMAMSAELWQRTGGFDEDYFLYWEDIDLCRRVHEVGGRVEVEPDVVAVHDEGGTHRDGGGRAKSQTFYYFMIRNRALYARKWLPAVDRRRWLRQTPRTAWDTMMTGGRRQFVQSLRPWRTYVRGVAAALKISAGGTAGPVSGHGRSRKPQSERSAS